MSTSLLIDVQDVTYTYPVQPRKVGREQESPPVPALRDISVRIQQGEYVVILGHNGSGKSTLARQCNALLLPDEGRVLVAGMDTRDPSCQRTIRERVGMIFQNPDNQLIATVVEDDVAWGLTVRGYAASEIRTRVDSALEAVGIAHLRQLPPHQLSGGQRQRLAIAGILALQPSCIIADEATSMLDPFSRQEMARLFATLHRELGLTIVQVTHLLEEAVYAERIVVMEQGRVLDDGTPAQIFGDLERLRALKLIIPDPLRLVARLRRAGFDLAPGAVSNEEIAREIAHA
ncbi:energy-coupling factor transporter ATPase [Dictyobacter aurantiacus]|uniref:Energy-coupling factor transporter ATP-binding protein EcfA1 n=1 Tax=Dictyobacter aurantiacus TaxID=1936993 RepID=A0A401ZJ56_9CHLR|nr:energy-coupling factor transporter ATPase [Dictyobacter aurantiacus]GCE06886.1 energy-coupling factor transporter ATP-binding protein EcfA1 [Dictyobacter aurantiacus]